MKKSARNIELNDKEIFSTTIHVKSLNEIIDHIQETKETLKSIFVEYANNNDSSTINIIDSGALLNEFFKILNLNVLSTSDYFNENNEKISEKYDLHALTFDLFLDLFIFWLESEVYAPKTDFEQESNKNCLVDLLKHHNNDDRIKVLRKIFNEEKNFTLLSKKRFFVEIVIGFLKKLNLKLDFIFSSEKVYDLLEAEFGKEIEKIDQSREQLEFISFLKILEKIAEKNKISYLKKDEDRELDKHIKILRKLFDHYCKREVNSNKNSTFEEVNRTKNNMNLFILFSFCKEFKLTEAPLSKSKIIEIFKKTSPNAKEINFDEFLTLLQSFADIYSSENEQTPPKEKFLTFINEKELTKPEKIKEILPLIFPQNPPALKRKSFSPSPPRITHLNSQQNLKPITTENKKLSRKKFISPSPSHKKKKELTHKKLDSYLFLQSKSLINRLNLKHDSTFKKLQQITFEDLKPILGKELFDPETLLDNNSDDSDKIYLAEYNLKSDRKEEDNLNKVKSYKLPFNFKKKEFSPNSRMQTELDKNMKKNTTYKELREKSPNFKNKLGNLDANIAVPYNQTILKIKDDILERAFKLESDERTKRNNMFKLIFQNQERKINAGLSSSRK